MNDYLYVIIQNYFSGIICCFSYNWIREISKPVDRLHFSSGQLFERQTTSMRI